MITVAAQDVIFFKQLVSNTEEKNFPYKYTKHIIWRGFFDLTMLMSWKAKLSIYRSVYVPTLTLLSWTLGRDRNN